jgi:hypothetical protein
LTKPRNFTNFKLYWVKFIHLLVSPVKNIFSSINLALFLIVIALATLSVRTWTHPKYNDRVDAASIISTPKTLKPLALKRKAYNSGIVAATVQGNLFRKDRREFMPPPPRVVPIAQVAQAPALPPPNIKLRGVMLLGARKIAIMEGNYPVREGNQAIKQKPLVRKGYPLGSQIGNFELTQIEKNKVTLDNKRGVLLNLSLSQRPEDKIIRKVGNSLVQKDKNFDPRKVKKPAPPRPSPRRVTARPPKNTPKPVPAPRTFRVSGAPTELPGGIPKPRISGR